MYTLLVPRERSLKEKKSGRNSPFWKTFWQKQIADNPDHYRAEYARRVSRLSNSVKAINEKYKAPGRYYVEARLDDFVDAKTKEPNAIWKESGIQVVETREDGAVTLGGSHQAFQKLEAIVDRANFGQAQQERVSKGQNLAREVFSVTSLIDKNASPEKRLARELERVVVSGIPDKVSCIITVYYDRSNSEYESMYGLLATKIGEDKITKVDTRFFVNNMIFRGSLSGPDIKKILEDPQLNFVSYIKPTTLFSAQRTTPNNEPRDLSIGRPATDEKVVVIDSGIDNPTINRFVTHRESFLANGEAEDLDHGTSVASRLLFGDDIFSGVSAATPLTPIGKIIDVKVLHRDAHDHLFVPDDVLMRAIDQSIRRHGPDATIFNLSVSAEEQLDEHNVSEITELIDDRLSKNDVLFVCAVGNQKGNFPLGYDHIFNTPTADCHVAAPADALNALSVGSVASMADTNSICPTPNLPSPFTRKGGYRNDQKKPELVAPGGNIRIDTTDAYDPAHLKTSHRTYGVQIIDTTGFNRDVGTSFSAPLISRECLRILDYLKKSNLSQSLPGFASNKANLVKALMIHSTERVSQPSMPNDGLKRAYGWGQASSKAVLEDNEDQITLVYADKINFSEKKQKILVKLPQSLLNKPVELVLTLVYNPPVNKNFKEYKMIELQPSIGFIHPKTITTGKTKTLSNTPSHDWENYRSSHFNTIHFKKLRKRLTGVDLQVLVQMLVATRLADEHIGHEEDISQNYALVLTVRDMSASKTFRSEILNSNQFIELVENVVEVES